jgi:hypothetical protein
MHDIRGLLLAACCLIALKIERQTERFALWSQGLLCVEHTFFGDAGFLAAITSIAPVVLP